MFIGQMIQMGFQYADLFGLEVVILSGKYGFITPETTIDPYDERLKVWKGNWPDGSGCWLGDSVYFKEAPERFRRLLPYSYNQTYGQQLQLLNECLLYGRKGWHEDL